jgi:hypothetical protein
LKQVETEKDDECRPSIAVANEVKIILGRPEWDAVFANFNVDAADPRELGVWTAGPKVFNAMVGDAARKSKHNVRVQNVAFEL